MSSPPLLTQAALVHAAEELIQLGARMQVLEDLTPMPREKLLRLYKEVKGEAPPRGMLPFSTEWFMEWQPSIHSALYLAQRNQVKKLTRIDARQALAVSYRRYLAAIEACGLKPVLSLTRAWSLERFVNAKMLVEKKCCKCSGVFLSATPTDRSFTCGLCRSPVRLEKIESEIDVP